MLPKLTPPAILDGYRDLGTMSRSGDHQRLACDPIFNRHTSFWLLGETLDATYAGLEGLARALPPERWAQFKKKYRSKILTFLADHFDSKAGRFFTDGSQRTGGIFASHVAIGILKSLEGKDLSQRLTQRRYVGLLREMGLTGSLSSPLERIRCLLDTSYKESTIKGALVDSAESELPPSLTVLYTASTVLWNLARDFESCFFSIVDKAEVYRFVRSCIKTRNEAGVLVSGFTIHPDIDELCVNTTFFGLRLLRRLGLETELINSDLKDRLLVFIKTSFREGGFVSTMRERRSLNATFFGLKALQMLATKKEYLKFLKKHGRSISRMVDRCFNNETDGAAFAAQSEQYVENCLATRYALDIQQQIPEGRNLSDWPSARIADFFLGQYQADSGGFRGYPDRRIDKRKGFSGEQLEGLLRKKDQLLWRLIDGQAEGEAQMEALHAELGYLYLRREKGGDESIEQKIAAKIGELGALQEDLAGRWARSLERRLTPIEEGWKLLERLDSTYRDYEDSSPADSASST